MKVLAHVTTIVTAAAVFFALPFVAFADFDALGGDVDLVSSATVIQDAPSGRYTIFVNRDLHPRQEDLDKWVAFFEGRDVPLIMEDVSCVALSEDAAGIEMAESLQSRLPANQMKLRFEPGALALSKAEAGRFDVIVMSDEAAQSFQASTVASLPFVEVVNR